MRRRQKYHALKLAAQEALSSVPSPAQFTGGPLTIGTPVKPITIIDPDACTKCGRTVGRGRAMHEKHCKGKAA